MGRKRIQRPPDSKAAGGRKGHRGPEGPEGGESLRVPEIAGGVSAADGMNGGPPAPAVRRIRAFRFAALVLGLILGFAALEAFLQAARFGPVFWAPPPAGYQIEYDPDLLYRIKPASGPGINSLGQYDAEPRSGPVRRILMAGDSFVMGLTLPRDKTIPNALERRLGPDFEVQNLGVLGYGPDQSWLALQAAGYAPRPEAVVLGLFPANDFNDLAKNELLTLNDRNEWIFNPENPVASILPRVKTPMLLRRLATGDFFPKTDNEALFDRLFVDSYDHLTDRAALPSLFKIDLMNGVLRKFASDLGERGIPFLVFIVPSICAAQKMEICGADAPPADQPFVNELLAAELLTAAGIPHVDLSRPFLARRAEGLYDEGNAHLSEAGAEAAAELIQPRLMELLIPPGGGA